MLFRESLSVTNNALANDTLVTFDQLLHNNGDISWGLTCVVTTAVTGDERHVPHSQHIAG